MLCIGNKEVALSHKNAKNLYIGSHFIAPMFKKVIDTHLGARLGDVATVVGTYYDGSNQKWLVAVVDSQYRRGYPSNTQWGYIGTDLHLPFAKQVSNYYSGHYYTDIIISGSPAASVAVNSCSVTINGEVHRPVLPTLYELKMVVDNKEEIYNYDETLRDYFTRGSSMWSCQENGQYEACVFTKDGSVGWNQKQNMYQMILPLFVIPL